MRDDYTTLPERRDRPLHVYLDVFWTYLNPATGATGQAAGYVPSEQVKDVVVRTFDDFVSMSIQHLVHEMETAAGPLPAAGERPLRGPEPALGHVSRSFGRAGQGLQRP